jgi:predicted ATPase
VFTRACDAVAAALRLQRSLGSEKWPDTTPIRVRIAVHTGTAELRAGDYFGGTVNRAARLRAIAHGGQTILSRATEEQARDLLQKDVHLRDLGPHRLKDLARPEHVFQLCHPKLPDRFPLLRSLNPRQTNLPVQLTSFIGREEEIAAVDTLLQKTRLVTLTGAGGAGKTRLALQVGADTVDRFPDGVLLVDLSPLLDGALVPQAIASAVGVRERAAEPLTTTLANALQGKSILLVLDNCEQVIETCAEVADGLLRSCLELSIVATSREPLAVPGEATFRVPSLAAPVVDAVSPTEVEAFDAVRLFVDRAALARPGFTLDDTNVSAVAQICHRLDGIPLALELAAAGLRTLNAEQIRERLDDRFRLLTSGPRTVPRRHQTLRGAVDWSYDLLSVPERSLLGRLSVFAGGCNTETVRAVCSATPLDETAAEELLRSLADKSLVVVSERDGRLRYAMLETIRQYAAERLEESDEDERLRRGHCERFLALAENFDSSFAGQKALIEQMDEEHDNLRQSLAWAIGSEHDRHAAVRLAGALSYYWFHRGFVSEGRRWFDLVLAAPSDGPPQAQVKALTGAGMLASHQFDTAAARRFNEDAVAMARHSGDRRTIASSLRWLARFEMLQGNHDRSAAVFDEALAIARQIGDKTVILDALHDLAIQAVNRCDYPTARARETESLALVHELGHTWSAGRSVYLFGSIAYGEGNLEAAQAPVEETIGLWRETGNRFGVAMCTNHLGLISYATGDLASARTFFQEALTIRREIDDVMGRIETSARLAGVATAEGNAVEARSLLEESTSLVRKVGDRYSAALILEEWGALYATERRPERAARLFGVAHSLRDALGYCRPQPEEGTWRRRLQDVKGMIGPEAFSAEWDAGLTASPEEELDGAISDPTR